MSEMSEAKGISLDNPEEDLNLTMENSNLIEIGNETQKIDSDGNAVKKSLSDENTNFPKGMKAYWNLLKLFPVYRYFFMSSSVSVFGDFLTEIACFSLLNKYWNSATAIGLYLLIRDLPNILMSPITGVVADSFDRRKVILITELARAVIVLGFIVTQLLESIWLLYLLSFIQLSAASFIAPAFQSLVPEIVDKEYLVVANVLDSLTWSTVLMIGAASGGVIVFFLGTIWNFSLNSLTYLISALFVSRVFFVSSKQSKPISPTIVEKHNELKKVNLLHKIKEGWISYKLGLNFLWKNKFFFAFSLAKASGMLTWAAAEIIVVKVASEIYPMIDSSGISDSSLSLGMIYFSTGLGVGLGPLVVERIVKESDSNNKILVLVGMAILGTGVGLISIPYLPFPVYCFVNAFRTLGSGLVWIYSTVILQRAIPKEIQGRIFAFEYASLTVASVISRGICSLLLDYFEFTVFSTPMFFCFSAFTIFSVWCFFIWKTWGIDFQSKIGSSEFGSKEKQDEKNIEKTNLSEILLTEK